MRVHNAPLELMIVCSKGRPKGSLNVNGTSCARSTKRDPSLFKHVEQAEHEEAVKAPVPSSTMLGKSTTKKRGLEFIEEYGDNYEPGTQMQRGYQRRQTPVSDDEPCKAPINLTGDSDDGSSKKVSVLVQDVLEELDMDEWADMEGKLAEEENAVS